MKTNSKNLPFSFSLIVFFIALLFFLVGTVRLAQNEPLLSWFSLKNGVSWMFLGAMGSMLLCIWFIFLNERKIHISENLLNNIARSIADQGISHVIQALVHLTMGDFTSTIEVGTTSVDLKPLSRLKTLAATIQQLGEKVNEAAKELNVLTVEPLERLFYIGSESFQEGMVCGETMGKILGGIGKVVILTAFFNQRALELREKGFEQVLRDKYPQISIVGRAEHFFDTKQAELLVREWLNKVPDLAAFYITDSTGTPVVGRVVSEMKKAREVKIIGYDLMDETMQYVSQGVISAVLSQDPYAQGHDSVIYL
jgi:hypothetical protein